MIQLVPAQIKFLVFSSNKTSSYTQKKASLFSACAADVAKKPVPKMSKSMLRHSSPTMVLLTWLSSIDKASSHAAYSILSAAQTSSFDIPSAWTHAEEEPLAAAGPSLPPPQLDESFNPSPLELVGRSTEEEPPLPPGSLPFPPPRPLAPPPQPSTSPPPLPPSTPLPALPPPPSPPPWNLPSPPSRRSLRSSSGRSCSNASNFLYALLCHIWSFFQLLLWPPPSTQRPPQHPPPQPTPQFPPLQPPMPPPHPFPTLSPLRPPPSNPPRPPSAPLAEILPGSQITLPLSQHDQVLTLVRIEPETGREVSVARSYAGGAWEGPTAADPLFVECAVGRLQPCLIGALPSAPMDAPTTTYSLRQHVIDIPARSDARARAARLLLQATFGPTNAAIDEVLALSASAEREGWVIDQMARQATLMRPFYRERTHMFLENVWSTSQYYGDLTSSVDGGARGPCDEGSLWMPYALHNGDARRTLTVIPGGALLLDGLPHPALPSIRPTKNGVPSPFGTAFQLCTVDEWVGGDVTLELADVGCPISTSNSGQQVIMGGEHTMPNPRVAAPPEGATGGSATLGAGLAIFANVSSDRGFFGAAGGVRALQWIADTGLREHPTLCAPGTRRGTLRTLFWGGAWYRWDERARLRLLANDVRDPFNGPPAGGGTGICPSVPRSFLNEAHCRLAPACTPQTNLDTSERILDQSLLRRFWTQHALPVLRVAGVTLDDPHYDDSEARTPCTGSSRWVRRDSACSDATGFESPLTALNLAAALLTAASDANPQLRDVDVGYVDPLTICPTNADVEAARAAVVEAGGACWVHAHPSLHDVYDFSHWASAEGHPGGSEAILQWVKQGSVELVYPHQDRPNGVTGHDMARFEALAGKAAVPRLGRFGDRIAFRDLPHTLRTMDVAAWWGDAHAAQSAEPHVACGSPGEVASVPARGPAFMLQIRGNLRPRQHPAPILRAPHGLDNGESLHALWFEVVVSAPDQLRHRVAWALAQLLVVGRNSMDAHERYLHFYDTLLRHAFGDYRVLLREVSYGAKMGEFLTYLGNQPLSCLGSTRSANPCGAHPDENYARELMQLFTIGTVQLREDGVAVHPTIETYTNDDIIDMARVWTGLQSWPQRGNVERDATRINFIDPMRIEPNEHDAFPKMHLHQGHLGDGHPLCHEEPADGFLRQGAQFRYLGRNPPLWYQRSGVTAPPPVVAEGGALHAALCARHAGQATGCTFLIRAELPAAAMCAGADECAATAPPPRLWYVPDGAGSGAYFEYLPPRCVELGFFGQGREAARGGGALGELVCLNPVLPVAGVVCCASAGTGAPRAQCREAGEYVSWAEAESRCRALDGGVCSVGAGGDLSGGSECAYGSESGHRRFLVWQKGVSGCAQRVLIDPTGQVAVLHDLTVPARSMLRFQAGDGTTAGGGFFRVRWANGIHPGRDVTACAAAGCAANGRWCDCPVAAEEAPAFRDRLPASHREAEEELSIGAHFDAAHPPASHERCRTPACVLSEQRAGLRIFVARAAAGEVDGRAVFLMRVNGTTEERAFANRAAVVVVAGGAGRFRNPPQFMSATTSPDTHVGGERPVESEIETLLEHLVMHPNTAPFVARHLARSLVTSNPSPRYVREIARAFRTGIYGSRTYSGRPGDLGAAVAAALLDPEASAPELDADPDYGLVREPILKVVHLLRSLEVQIARGELLEVTIGEALLQQPLAPPSAFSFFSPFYRPAGRAASAHLVAPVAQVLSTTTHIVFLNGALDLVRQGGLRRAGCGGKLTSNQMLNLNCDALKATLTYRPRANTLLSARGAAVQDLDVLLTGRRADAATLARAAAGYQAEGLKGAQAAFVASPAFHTLGGAPRPSGVRPGTPNSSPALQDSAFRGLIVLYLEGGADSYNMLVPLAGCNGRDLHADYQQMRAGVAIPTADLLPIGDRNGAQPCATFALNGHMPNLHSLYQGGDAAFVANVGQLHEPLHAAQLRSGEKRPPYGLFAHDSASFAAKRVELNLASSREGVVGRMANELVAQGMSVATVSLSNRAGADLLDGTRVVPDLLAPKGVERFQPPHQRDGEAVRALLADTAYSSLAADVFGAGVKRSLDRVEKLDAALRGVPLTQSWSNNSLEVQMANAVRLMIQRRTLGVDRAVTYVQLDGFDTHRDANAALFSRLIGQMDQAIGKLTAELKAQGLADRVLLVSASEFGRTYTFNGRGTDHGWGGNHFLVGAKVRGRRIWGEYPHDAATPDDKNAGRGRFVPSVPWEGIWAPVAEWMGVTSPAALERVLPNAARFPPHQILKASQVFLS